MTFRENKEKMPLFRSNLWIIPIFTRLHQILINMSKQIRHFILLFALISFLVMNPSLSMQTDQVPRSSRSNHQANDHRPSVKAQIAAWLLSWIFSIKDPILRVERSHKLGNGDIKKIQQTTSVQFILKQSSSRPLNGTLMGTQPFRLKVSQAIFQAAGGTPQDINYEYEYKLFVSVETKEGNFKFEEVNDTNNQDPSRWPTFSLLSSSPKWRSSKELVSGHGNFVACYLGDNHTVEAHPWSLSDLGLKNLNKRGIMTLVILGAAIYHSITYLKDSILTSSIDQESALELDREDLSKDSISPKP